MIFSNILFKNILEKKFNCIYNYDENFIKLMGIDILYLYCLC